VLVFFYYLAFRLEEHATVIRNAIVNTITKHNVKTADIGGTATTTEFMKQVIEEIDSQTPEIGKIFSSMYTVY
jgi:isocitrate/isopropylmalate dehydrogenase